jgi:hypothetical protein
MELPSETTKLRSEVPLISNFTRASPMIEITFTKHCRNRAGDTAAFASPTWSIKIAKAREESLAEFAMA